MASVDVKHVVAREQWVYGWHAVTALLQQSPQQVTAIYLLQGRRDQRVQALLKQMEALGLQLHWQSRQQLDSQVNGRHQGVMAQVVGTTESPTAKDVLSLIHQRENPLLLVLDGVTDPHNFGACLRSADAAGVDAVLVPKDNAASVTEVVRKVACGAAETVPIFTVVNLARTLKSLQQAGVWLVGAAGEAEQSLYQVDLAGPLAIVMGAEGRGLRRLTREHCDYLVKLPMLGQVSSLNVSVATGICLYEALRQRGLGDSF